MKAEKRKKILIYIGLTFLAVLMIIPFYWMLISSVKLNKDVFSYGIGTGCILYNGSLWICKAGV